MKDLGQLKGQETQIVLNDDNIMFKEPYRFTVATPLLEECEDDTHTPKMGTWKSSETPETSEFNCRGQNTSP